MKTGWVPNSTRFEQVGRVPLRCDRENFWAVGNDDGGTTKRAENDPTENEE